MPDLQLGTVPVVQGCRRSAQRFETAHARHDGLDGLFAIDRLPFHQPGNRRSCWPCHHVTMPSREKARLVGILETLRRLRMHLINILRAIKTVIGCQMPHWHRQFTSLTAPVSASRASSSSNLSGCCIKLRSARASLCNAIGPGLPWSSQGGLRV